MHSALLHDGKLVTAVEFQKEFHGSRLFCIDCRTPLIFVPNSENSQAHFKTTGKNDSKHSSNCGFFKPLSFEESIQKVGEYQSSLLGKGIKENVIRLSLHTLDPDYQKKETVKDEQEKEKHKDPAEVKAKQESSTPNSISSLKAVVKLLTQYEPDLLASVIISVKGKKIPLSQMIVTPAQAHELLWKGQAIENINYFVYGEIEKVIRREKVYYINFKKPENGSLFSIVVFQKHFKHFTYPDNKLIGRMVLAWGGLKKNEFHEKQSTEILIKADKYLEFLPSQK